MCGISLPLKLDSNVRTFIVVIAVLATGLVAGCGSGSGSSGSGGGGGGGGTANIPTLASIAPSATVVGAADTVLTAYGSNFVATASIQWNGKALTTTWVSATQLTTVVPAADLAAKGSASVTVVNPDPLGGTSSPRNFSIDNPPPGATWIKAVPAVTVPWDMAWDAGRKRLYVSTAPQDPANPDAIVSIDPVSGTAGAPIAAGNNPHLIALSSDASYLWASLDDDHAVQRFRLPDFSKDVSFPIPVNPSLGTAQTLSSLEAARGNPHTLATAIYGQNGVYVYDDATPRPTFVPSWEPGGGPGVTTIQWGKDDSMLYGFGTFAGVFPLPVNGSGVKWDGTYQNLLSYNPPAYDPASGVAYSWLVANDLAHATQAGQFNAPGPDTACTADDILDRYYCFSVFSASGFDVYNFELWVFDLQTYALLDRYYVGTIVGSSAPQSTSPITGAPRKLLRWGNAGLALITSSGAEFNTSGAGIPYGWGGVFLIDGAAVNPGAAPDFSSGGSPSEYGYLKSVSPVSTAAGSGDAALTIKGYGFNPDSVVYCNYNSSNALTLPTTFVSSTELSATIPASELQAAGALTISVYDPAAGRLGTNSLTFVVAGQSGNTQVTAINLAGNGMAWDANGNRLYMGTSNLDPNYPNSIVAVSGTGVAQAQAVGSDPQFLSMGAQGQFLYAAYEGTTNIDQFAVPSLTRTSSAVLTNPNIGGPWLPGDMKAAPVSPHTAAVTLYSWGSTPRPQGGIAVFDDGVERPTVAPGWNGGQQVSAEYDVIAWTGSDQLLASAPNTYAGGPLYSLGVNDSGVFFLSAGEAQFSDGGEIHSDFGTGLIYSDDGNVADPSTGGVLGSYKASGLVLPDSSLNRVFILTQSAAQANTQDFTIVSFNENSFAQVSTLTLSKLVGSPFAFERWGSSGFAILTVNSNAGPWGGSYGMLYLVQDAGFVSAAEPAAGTGAGAATRYSWRPPSRQDVAAWGLRARRTLAR